MSERDDDIVKELKRMNGFLEAIDWKLWNMHKKLIEEDGGINTPTTTTKAADVPVVKDEAPVVPAIPKYPSIEKWS